MDALNWCLRQSTGSAVASLYQNDNGTPTPELGIDLKSGSASLRIPLAYYITKPSAETLQIYSSLMQELVQELVRKGAAVHCAESVSRPPANTSARRLTRVFDAPASAPAVSIAPALPRLLICDTDRSLEPKLEKYLGFLGYCVTTLSPGPETVATIPLMKPAALAIAQELPGTTGLDLLHALRAKSLLRVPAVCFSSAFTDAMKERAASLGDVTLLPRNAALSGALINWLQDVQPVVAVQPTAPPPVQPVKASASSGVLKVPADKEKMFDVLWERLAGRRVDELKSILGVEVQLADAGGAWKKFPFANVTVKILIKDQKISILGLE